jgi:hypothetical protein
MVEKENLAMMQNLEEDFRAKEKEIKCHIARCKEGFPG